MNSFKCSKCSYNTIRNHDLTRHLKNVHGIYANTSIKGDNQLQAAIPSRDMTDDDEEEEEGSITEQEFRTIQSELRTSKCRILDGVVESIPEHLKTKAKCICDILKRLDSFFVNSRHEILYRWRQIERV